MSQVKVPGRGPSKAKIMVVGEAPGREEVVEGKPFVGYAGRILDAHLRGAGINPDEIYFTNICKVQPPGNELVRFFEPKTGLPNNLVGEGLAELREEIEAVDPNVIVALGNYPLWALTGVNKWNPRKNAETQLPTGYTGIGDWRGSILAANGLAEGRKVVAAYHPAAIGRRWPWRVYLDLDLKRAREQAAFPDIRRPNRRIVVNPRGEDRDELRRMLLADDSRLVHFDIEYIGDRLLCCGFCNNSDEAFVIPTVSAADFSFVRSILESGIPLGAQNGMFDASVLEWHFKMNVMRNLKYDTMLAAHAAYIELPKDLGTLCSIYTEQPCYWTHISWPDIKKGKQPISDVFEYNGIDAWVTHEVANAQMDDELQNPLTRKTFEFEMGLLPVLWDISKVGVKVNLDGVKSLQTELKANIENYGCALQLIAGKQINVMSNPDMTWLLRDELKLPVRKVTKGGKASWDDKTLAELQLEAKDAKQIGALTFIREIRRNRSLDSKFCEIEWGADGRFRHHYSPAGTTTGRLSSKKFYPTGEGGNGQNIPRDKRIRSLFVADDGYTFFYNDLERAESFVVAQLTGDPLMLAHHAPGVNAHIELAALLFGLDKAGIPKDSFEYYMGKQTRHAGNYMQGARTFMVNVNSKAEQTGFSITLSQAKEFIDRYRSLHIGLGPWWNSIESEVRSTGKLTSLMGRERTFFDRIDQTLPEAIAYKPQSTVGDVLNYALLRMARDEELNDYGTQFLLQIHDAVGGQVPDQHLDAAMRRMGELMLVELLNPRTREPFTIRVELTCGPSWGQCKEWHPQLVEAA